MNRIKYRLSLKLYVEDNVMGPGMVELLKGIDSTGSLQSAARQMGLGYSKAWKMIRQAQKQLQIPLIETVRGGKEGGGSVLTTEARELINKYEKFLKEANNEVEMLYHKYFESES